MKHNHNAGIGLRRFVRFSIIFLLLLVFGTVVKGCSSMVFSGSRKTAIETNVSSVSKKSVFTLYPEEITLSAEKNRVAFIKVSGGYEPYTVFLADQAIVSARMKNNSLIEVTLGNPVASGTWQDSALLVMDGKGQIREAWIKQEAKKAD